MTPFLLLMPSYNQAHYIVDAVRSVLAQDDADWELWIVDNSSDNTPEVMRQFTDARIRFHHISSRMDPGSCLNWMLERAVGRDFSYVHTDNNLRPQYVRQMRAALASHPMSLAYCDMCSIDEHGRPLNIFRRGGFDLARLLSTDTLGVPFSATIELARQLDGFNAGDFADDVNFCVSAYGIAHYTHLPDVLIDYRLHSQSRTEIAGGASELDRLFIRLMLKLIPMLEQRGNAPLLALQAAITGGLNDMDYLVEDLWYRKLSKYCEQWWHGAVRIEPLFFAGLIEHLWFDNNSGKPPKSWTVRDHNQRNFTPPWSVWRVSHVLHRQRHELNRLKKKIRSMLPTWACSTLGLSPTTQLNFRVQSFDFRTLWIARQLELALNWKPHLDTSISSAPAWLRWPAAQGTEPLLDCRTNVSLVAASIQ